MRAGKRVQLRCLLFTVLLTFLSCTTVDSGAPPSTAFPAAALTSTTDPATGWRFELRTAPNQPPTTAGGSGEIRVLDDKSQPVENLTLHVQAWMPSMNHGSSPDPAVTTNGAGRYLLAPLNLFMAGTWQVRVAFATVTGASGQIVEQFDVQ